MTIDGVFDGCKKAYSDWSEQLINPRMVRIGTKLTWHGDRRVRVDEPLQEEDVAAIISAGAFSFQVRQDEAVIQLMYEFDRGGRRLQLASLAYFALTVGAIEGFTEVSEPSSAAEEGAESTSEGTGTSRAEDEFSEVSETSREAEEGSDSAPESRVTSGPGERREGRIDAARYAGGGVSWLRIDYQDGERGGVLHHDCHMHVGGFPDSRLPLNCVPNPHQFIEWIFAFRYPGIYRRHRLDGSNSYRRVEDARQINTPQFPVELRDVAVCVPHLAFPKGAALPSSA